MFKGDCQFGITLGVMTQAAKREYLPVLWSSLLAQIEQKPLEIILVAEEGYTPLYPEELRKRYSIRHFYYQRPFHIGAVRNQIAHWARGEILVFLDDDVAIGPHYFKTVLETFETEGAALIAGLTYQLFRKPEEFLALLQQLPWEELISLVGKRDSYTKRIGRYQSEQLPEGNWLGSIGRNMAIQRKLVLASPFFEFKNMGFEDLEFAYRQQMAGYNIVLKNTPHLACLHLFHSQDPSKIQEYRRTFEILIEKEKLPLTSRKWFFSD